MKRNFWVPALVWAAENSLKIMLPTRKDRLYLTDKQEWLKWGCGWRGSRFQKVEQRTKVHQSCRPGPTLCTVHAPNQRDLLTDACLNCRNAMEQGLLHVFHLLCFELLLSPQCHHHDSCFCCYITTTFHFVLLDSAPPFY